MKFIACILLLLTCSWAHALTLEDTLENETQEQSVQALFQEIRCVVCNGQSIADSRSELAGEIRKIIREKVIGNYSDKQIKEYLVSRYGDSILMKPTLDRSTYLLWFGPIIILFSGFFILAWYVWQNKNSTRH